MEYVPGGAVGATAIVIFDEPAPGASTDVGVKVTLTPSGCPLAVSATDESNPPLGMVVIVEFAVLPGATEADVGKADSAKVEFSGAGMVSETVWETILDNLR